MSEDLSQSIVVECWCDTIANGPDASFAAYSSPQVRSAATEQDRIGLHNLLEGRISRKWRTLQAAELRRRESKRTVNGWCGRAVLAVLEFSHRMWKQRCEILHATDGQGNSLSAVEETEERVRAEFEQGFEELTRTAEDRDLHEDLTVNTILGLLHREKLTWLHAVEMARQANADAPDDDSETPH